MFSCSLFAAIQKLNVDPETMHQINVIGIGTFILIFIALLGILAWHGVPFFYSYNRNRREEKHRASNAIWFDSNDSELHCGHSKIRIEPRSFEYFVCELTFKSPSTYHDDLDIFDEADRVKGSKETRRGVEQAVRRLNKKAKSLGLQNDLLKRGKDNTSVNDEYRQHIVNG